MSLVSPGSTSQAGVIVAQIGARRHYAVPLAFHAHGHLQRLCTDLLVSSPRFGAMLRTSGRLLGSPALGRLADRQSGAQLPDQLIKTFPLFGLRYKFQAQRARSAAERTANWLWGGEYFARRCATQLDQRTRAVYGFSSASKELFEAAKSFNVHCWLDHATAPRAFEVNLIQEEAKRFPGWSARPVDDALTDSYLQRQREELALADLVICGSSFAKRAIVAEGINADRVVAVPLGLADHMYVDQSVQSDSTRSELRVLYVGGDGLRKGIGYLGQALERLSARSIRTKAAGDLGLSSTANAVLERHMQLLGTVARSEMPDLFRWADVLVLPSISDTFGFVILEAMAAGLVVIASENCAAPDVLRDGEDGFVVPIRDPEAIANALDKLAADPALLAQMSALARQRATEFSVARYGERLVASLGLDAATRVP